MGAIEVLLIKPGGPFWRNQDAGAWMIPKGASSRAKRRPKPRCASSRRRPGPRLTAMPFPLATVRQAGGKIVEAFAAEGDLDAAAIRSIEFEVEWPPRSGRHRALSRGRRSALDDASPKPAR